MADRQLPAAAHAMMRCPCAAAQEGMRACVLSLAGDQRTDKHLLLQAQSLDAEAADPQLPAATHALMGCLGAAQEDARLANCYCTSRRANVYVLPNKHLMLQAQGTGCRGG